MTLDAKDINGYDMLAGYLEDCSYAIIMQSTLYYVDFKIRHLLDAAVKIRACWTIRTRTLTNLT